MQVTFIIPLYNCLPLTQAMLASLRETLPSGLTSEIIFVDDGSTDGTRAWLHTLAPDCRAILNDKNMGFAATCNRGAEAATGEILVFLNNDLILLPNWLEPMLTALEQNRTFGAIGNLQVRVDNGALDHAGLMITPDGKIAHVRRHPRESGVIEVPAITAACLMIRRSVFEAAGGFDPEFKNGGEDVDLCFRLRAQGLKCGVATASVVRHHVSAARGPTSERDERNSRLLVQRWPDELIYWGAHTWARQQVETFLSQPWTREGRRALVSWPFAKGWTRQPPRFARLLLTSALHREMVRWARLFDQPAHTPRAPQVAAHYQETGFLRDDIDACSTWLSNQGTIHLPAGFPVSNLFVSGFLLLAPTKRAYANRAIGLRLIINGLQVAEFPNLPPGNFNLGLDAPFVLPGQATRVDLQLIGASKTEFFAWLEHITFWLPLSKIMRRSPARFHRKTLNRRLRVARIICDDEVIFDFKNQPALHSILRGNRDVTPRQADSH